MATGYRPGTPPGSEPKFDIIAWYPHHQSCLRYFLNVAQHSYPCQALATFLNIRLPFQQEAATTEFVNHSPRSSQSPRQSPGIPPWVSVIPYIRRLIATGFDKPGILHGWFGDDWSLGIGPMHESERRNYLFTAKSGGWAVVKKNYDMSDDQSIPFLRPLDTIHVGELESAEASWSNWMEMEDWMLGARAFPSGSIPLSRRTVDGGN